MWCICIWVTWFYGCLLFTRLLLFVQTLLRENWFSIIIVSESFLVNDLQTLIVYLICNWQTTSGKCQLSWLVAFLFSFFFTNTVIVFHSVPPLLSLLFSAVNGEVGKYYGTGSRNQRPWFTDHATSVLLCVIYLVRKKISTHTQAHTHMTSWLVESRLAACETRDERLKIVLSTIFILSW